MKVLFAVNNDNVSEAIVQKYQKEYKEILSYKNVYYFNAILRELQKDKSYSRIVISEDLEPFANNNYDSIDKFLFEKYSNISEEARSINNDKIDIILICADRRKKTDNMIAKMYKADIYSAIIGQDRSIDTICRLIYHPRDKEEAKIYYSIRESEFAESESETSVSEAEVENIRAHYARLGRNEDKYLESFNNIVAQYTDTQLKIIIKYLPMNVKAVLEAKSPKYQQLVTNSAVTGMDFKRKTANYKELIKNKPEEEEKKDDDVVQQLVKPKKIKSVVIPTALNTSNVQKVVIPEINKPEIKPDKIEVNISEEKEMSEKKVQILDELDEVDIKETKNGEDEETKPQKKGRGRPRKNPLPEVEEIKPKRGRGRPKKNPVVETMVEEKSNLENNNELETIEVKQENKEIDLFNIEEDNNENKVVEKELDLFSIDEEEQEEVDLFSIEEKVDEEVDLFNIEEKADEELDLFSITEESNETVPKTPVIQKNLEQEENTKNNYMTRTSMINSNFNTLLTGDKKIVAFVGTTKNGTSFIVNNTAEMLSSMGIETAILDMTKTKNAYYIYTDDKENLRTIAKNCMENLHNGIAEGIKVHKNLTIYTEMPGDEKEYEIESVLATLLKNYSAILIDTDFDTSPEVFEKAQEIYLVQSMDVLTIQPLTAFLRNLKSKGILRPEKLKIVINKSEKVRSLNARTLIGGMSCYNSPNMTYMTELFDKDNIKYCEIPFEVQNYVKYLDSLVNCSITLNGYTKQFMMALRELANMVYPLVNRQAYAPMGGKRERRDPFSNQVNDTLSKMRNKY